VVARAIEVCVAFILLLGMVFSLHAASVVRAPLVKEAIALDEQLAKQTLLALENFNSTGDGLEDKSIVELVALGYLTGREEFFAQAEGDIEYYLPRVLDAEWHVYTEDGMLDVESPGFGATKTRGSAETAVMSFTMLVVVVGF
jgi:hypothetical protein